MSKVEDRHRDRHVSWPTRHPSPPMSSPTKQTGSLLWRKTI